MSATALLMVALAAGVRIRIDGDRLVLSADRRPDESLLADLRTRKTKILDLLRGGNGWAPEDWQAFFDERAAIIEFDGGLMRAEAERCAEVETETLRRQVRDFSAAPSPSGALSSLPSARRSAHRGRPSVRP